MEKEAATQGSIHDSEYNVSTSDQKRDRYLEIRLVLGYGI
jgi:hypothetical protein